MSVSTLDMRTSTNLLAKQLGEKAEFVTAQRADAMLAKNDMDGQRDQ